MQQLGARHQVISITHFPQVAALASHHYLVQKASAGNRTISCLREVDQEERIDELARMLGGGAITPAHWPRLFCKPPDILFQPLLPQGETLPCDASRTYFSRWGLNVRSLRELNTTHRELRLMAAAAIIGFNAMPKAGYRAPAARGMPIVL